VLKVANQKLGGVAILRCQGRIVRGQETAILCAAAQQNGRDVILDLSQVNAIDAGGLGALVSLRAAGICLKLMDPTARVREILRLTKLDSIFEICESESIDVMLVEMGRPGDKSHACFESELPRTPARHARKDLSRRVASCARHAHSPFGNFDLAEQALREDWSS